MTLAVRPNTVHTRTYNKIRTSNNIPHIENSIKQPLDITNIVIDDDDNNNNYNNKYTSEIWFLTLREDQRLRMS
jgi:hypothetical protein